MGFTNFLDSIDQPYLDKADRVVKCLMFGAGVQSTALYLMMHYGEIECADYAIFADTQDEPASVYKHLTYLRENFDRPKIIVRSKGNLGDQLSTGEANANGSVVAIPAFTNEDGHEGVMQRQCTGVYKIDVCKRAIRRKILKLAKKERIPGDVAIKQYFGISTDEAGRAFKIRKARRPPWFPVFPLIELGMTRGDCIEYLKTKLPYAVPRSACVYCLAGSTGVLTPSGEKPINTLVGKSTLLIPGGGSYGRWQEVEVHSFGKQPVFEITLARGTSTMSFKATAEHRWVVDGKARALQNRQFVRTDQLEQGDWLATCFRPALSCSGAFVHVASIGVAHGFSFGDGSNPSRKAGPGSVAFYGAKYEDLKSYFSNCRITLRRSIEGVKYFQANDLPRSWKNVPGLDESRSYLLGWLAGYFAADGHVSERGQATLYSSIRENLQAVKDVCVVLGVDTSPIRTKSRYGFGKFCSIHSVTLCAEDLPQEFWIRKKHRLPVLEHQKHITKERSKRTRHWTVCSVSLSGMEEVFCATVPGVEMFTLTNNILTGNCPYKTDLEWLRLKTSDPEGWKRAVEIDNVLRDKSSAVCKAYRSDLYLHPTRQPLVQIDFQKEIAANPHRNSISGYATECLGMCGN